MIYILVPAFNEEEALPKMIPYLDEIFSQKTLDFKLVVVDDGSTDETPRILANFSDQYTNLHVITHSINRGLGETERDGFEYIAGIANDEDIIIRVEGDATHDPKYIFNLIDKVESGFDVVNTSRFAPGGDQKGLNSYRKFISYCANGFMKLLFNIKGVRDYSCGFRAYRARIIKDALSVFGNSFVQLKGLGFTSTLEMIVKLKILGAKFSEVPFVLRYDLKESESKMVSSITTLGYFAMGLLYHWPFGGWKSQFKGLAKAYNQDRESAIQKFNIYNIRRRTVSRIGG